MLLNFKIGKFGFKQGIRLWKNLTKNVGRFEPTPFIN